MHQRNTSVPAPHAERAWRPCPAWQISVVVLAAVWATGRVAPAAEGDVVISVYQGVCKEGDFGANLAAVRAAIEQAKERHSHFVAFPECFLSGYESREAVERGARALDHPELVTFIGESASHDMVVLVGLA